jgi:hypothetical protein
LPPVDDDGSRIRTADGKSQTPPWLAIGLRQLTKARTERILMLRLINVERNNEGHPMNFDAKKVNDVAAFREGVKAHEGRDLAEITNLKDDPNEPRLKTGLMKIACQILLRVRDVDVGRMIIAGEIFKITDDEWLDPVRTAVEFVEAEDAGAFVVGG